VGDSRPRLFRGAQASVLFSVVAARRDQKQAELRSTDSRGRLSPPAQDPSPKTATLKQKMAGPTPCHSLNF